MVNAIELKKGMIFSQDGKLMRDELDYLYVDESSSFAPVN